jgi:hypothetical protein
MASEMACSRAREVAEVARSHTFAAVARVIVPCSFLSCDRTKGVQEAAPYDLS